LNPILPPPVPDYQDLSNWAALPDQEDEADVVPPNSTAVDRQATANADVFFLNPTTYHNGLSWNASVSDWLTNYITDTGILPQQAGAFNGSAKVYAPRYRQMTMGGYFVKDKKGKEAALALAYRDVKSAFEYYLKHWNNGRPIILAGHSQGSQHTLRLLEEVFDGSPLQKQLVAAYIVGFSVSDGKYLRGESNIRLCDTPDQVGCLISWRTFAEGGDSSLGGKPPLEDEQSVCVNPLSWTRDQERANKTMNLGSIPLIGALGLSEPDPQLVGAQCREGILWIEEPDASGYSFALFPGKNYHTYDYNLFYMNIRKNVQQRVEAYLGKSGGG